MPLDFPATPQRMLPKPDEPMRIGQIPVECQRLPTFRDTVGGAVCPNLNRAEKHVSSGMVRRPQQHIVQRLLRGPDMRRPVIGHGGRIDCQIDVSRGNGSFNMVRIKRKSSYEEILRARHDRRRYSLAPESPALKV